MLIATQYPIQKKRIVHTWPISSVCCCYRRRRLLVSSHFFFWIWKWVPVFCFSPPSFSLLLFFLRVKPFHQIECTSYVANLANDSGPSIFRTCTMCDWQPTIVPIPCEDCWFWPWKHHYVPSDPSDLEAVSCAPPTCTIPYEACIDRSWTTTTTTTTHTMTTTIEKLSWSYCYNWYCYSWW